MFDKDYISPTVRAMRMNEFINLKQGDMTITEYEKKFTSLSYFIDSINLFDYVKARMFENKVHLRSKISYLLRGYPY